MKFFSQKGDDFGYDKHKLGNLGIITSSKRIYKSEYVKEGIPFYRTKEIKELANDKEISLELFISEEKYLEIKEKFGVPKIGDILMSAVGTIGEILVIENENRFYFKDGNIVWFKDFNDVNSFYLKYLLRTFVENLKSLAKGAAYSALTIEKIKEYEVYIPNTLEEQQKIVTQLDQLQEQTNLLVTKYKQKLANLEELKKVF
ncbi:restriction endonuclease subunit S [Flavobacterium piscinae]|uniref:restriction endonuclease subunit S n=1 Tax=Flavobacterium piscinae TaxID=2506424 RepID=UPI0019BEA53A|nr:restriction endonuclease subunit S [Flavobacterium piscinae]MBC8882614.1 restriction endonuclease subunit S [Flavobacterium piscinae]